MIWLVLVMLLIVGFAFRDGWRHGELLWVVTFGLLGTMLVTCICISLATGIGL